MNDSAGSGIDRDAITVVDVDGNDPDSLTLRAVRALTRPMSSCSMSESRADISILRAEGEENQHREDHA